MFTSTAVCLSKLYNISEDMAIYVIHKGKHEALRKRAPDEENEQDEIKTWRSRLNGLMVEYDMDNSKQLATVRCVNLDYALDPNYVPWLQRKLDRCTTSLRKRNHRIHHRIPSNHSWDFWNHPDAQVYVECTESVLVHHGRALK